MRIIRWGFGLCKRVLSILVWIEGKQRQSADVVRSFEISKMGAMFLWQTIKHSTDLTSLRPLALVSRFVRLATRYNSINSSPCESELPQDTSFTQRLSLHTSMDRIGKIQLCLRVH